MWKIAAISMALVYFYKLSQSQGTTLASGPMGSRINPDNIVNLASQIVPEEWRGHAKSFGNVIINKVMNKE
jgi:hypothetical protein